MTHPTERAPTLEQVQRDREWLRQVVEYAHELQAQVTRTTHDPMTLRDVVQSVQDVFAPLPEPEPKTVPTTNGDGEHIEYRRFADGHYEIRGAEAFNGNKWGATAYTDEQVRALASLLPENATPAAQPAPTPRTFALEEVLEKVPRIFDLFAHFMQSVGTAHDHLRAAIIRALTAEQEPRNV